MNLSPRVKRFLGKFEEPRTCNEVIDEIFEEDVNDGVALEKGPRYYNHLNKLPAVLWRNGYLDEVGEKPGPTGKWEKVWRRLK